MSYQGFCYDPDYIVETSKYCDIITVVEEHDFKERFPEEYKSGAKAVIWDNVENKVVRVIKPESKSKSVKKKRGGKK